MRQKNEQEEKEIIRMYNEGISARKIEKLYKVNRKTVYKILDKYNIQKRYNPANLEGQKFTCLTVEKRIPDKTRNVYWVCWCDCGNGNPVIVNTMSLRAGKVKSCGCHRRNWNWKGYKDLSGGTWSRIRKGAEKRNLEFSISIKDAYEILEKQDFKCVYTGVGLYLNKSARKARRGEEHYGTASIDRIDSSKGYVEGNIQWVHKNVNFIKNTLSHNEFLSICCLIAENCKNINYNTIDLTYWFEFCFRDKHEYPKTPLDKTRRL